MQWWDDFWKWADTSPLGGTVVGGLIVAAVVAVGGLVVAIVPKWRGPVFAAIQRTWAFITSIRITTTTRIDAAREAARRELVDKPPPSPNYRLVPLDKSKELTASANVPPAAPVVRDRVSWSARRRAGGDFVLTNLSTTDCARHVAVASSALVLDHPSQSPSWDEIGPKDTVYFDADRDPKVTGRDILLEVVWEDPDGRAHQDEFSVYGMH